MEHFLDVGATYIKSGCILLHWPAYWSRTFLHCPCPMKSAFHPSGPSRMLPANPSVYFILLLLKNCTDTCQCIKEHCKTGCRRSAQCINHGSSFVCETAAWNKLLLFFCLAAPRSGLYLFFPWRALFPECLQMKVTLRDRIVTSAQLLQCCYHPVYKYFGICTVLCKPIKNM